MASVAYHVAFDQIELADEFPAVTEYSSIDHAFELGRLAALDADGFEDVFPPAELNPAEAYAFREGTVVGYRLKEFEIDDARDSSLDDWQVEELYEEWCYRNGLDYDRADYGHNANEWETV